MTQTLPAPQAGDTKRAYLVRLGLAAEFGKDGVTPARGRFSNDGQAALDAHPDFQWADAPKSTPKDNKATSASVPGASTPAPRPAVTTPAPQGTTANLSSKEVRAWAKANGVRVGERGRIHPSVIDAFQRATGKVPTSQQSAPRPTPLDMPKVRRESTGFSVVGGILTSQRECGNAGKDGMRHSVASCTCKGGPRAYSYLEREAGQTVFLTLDKPAL